jgi:hypothetical protein
MISGTAALAGLVRPASEADEPGAHRMLPVVAELGSLLPGRGLRRGSTVAVAGGRAAGVGGGTSLMLALLAAASRAGSWCAVVGLPALGALAAAETGIALERLALVPEPGPDWPTVVAALIDGVDVVVTAVPGPVSASVVGRLAARARQRGSVLVPFGAWSGADVTLQVSHGQWEGLGDGWGRLRRREVTVVANGRGAAARPKELTLWMPGLTAHPGAPAPRPAAPRTHPGDPAIHPATPPSTSGSRPLHCVPASANADVSPIRPAAEPVGVDRRVVSVGAATEWPTGGAGFARPQSGAVARERTGERTRNASSSRSSPSRGEVGAPMPQRKRSEAGAGLAVPQRKRGGVADAASRGWRVAVPVPPVGD